MRENRSAYQRLWFRPRILRDVTNVDFSTTMLGTKCSLPVYITATALVCFAVVKFKFKIANCHANAGQARVIVSVYLPSCITHTCLRSHKDGEVNLTKAGAKHNIIQMIPTLASCSFDEIVAAAAKDQVQWMQLYVNKDREITKKIVQSVH